MAKSKKKSIKSKQRKKRARKEKALTSCEVSIKREQKVAVSSPSSSTANKHMEGECHLI